MGKTSFHCPKCHKFTLGHYKDGHDRYTLCPCGYDSREDDRDEDSYMEDANDTKTDHA